MKKYNALLIMFFGVVFIQGLLGFAVYYAIPGWDTRNSFGGMFGAINTLFSGLAFCGVIYAIILQGRELELQREELALNREELSLHRNELSKSAEAQSNQAKLMLLASKINAISIRLEIASEMYLNNRNIPKGSGANDSLDSRDEMRKLYAELVRLHSEDV